MFFNPVGSYLVSLNSITACILKIRKSVLDRDEMPENVTFHRSCTDCCGKNNIRGYKTS